MTTFRQNTYQLHKKSHIRKPISSVESILLDPEKQRVRVRSETNWHVVYKVPEKIEVGWQFRRPVGHRVCRLCIGALKVSWGRCWFNFSSRFERSFRSCDRSARGHCSVINRMRVGMRVSGRSIFIPSKNANCFLHEEESSESQENSKTMIGSSPNQGNKKITLHTQSGCFSSLRPWWNERLNLGVCHGNYEGQDAKTRLTKGHLSG